MKLITAQYNSATNYYYKYDGDDLKVGDIVVGEYTNTLGIVLRVINIVELQGQQTNRIQGWIVSKVDMRAFKERQDRQNRITALQKTLDDKLKEFNKQNSLRLLLLEDAEAQKLAAEIACLKGN